MLHKRRGITSVEVLIAATLCALIATVILPFTQLGGTSYGKTHRQTEIMQNARIILDKTIRELMQAKRLIAISAPLDTQGYVEFIGRNDSQKRLERHWDEGLNDWAVGINGVPLGYPVESLCFVGYLGDGVTTTTNPIRVKSIEIAITVPDREGLVDPVSLIDGVNLRLKGIPSIFGWAVIAKTDLKISGNPTTTSAPEIHWGDIHANRDIYLIGDNNIDGEATASGKVDITGNPFIYGGYEGGVNPVQFPEIDLAEWYEAAIPQGTTVGDVTIKSGSVVLQGVINGNLDIGGNATVTINGVVYVTGNVEISSNSVIDSQNGALVAEGTVTLAGNARTPNTAKLTIISASTSQDAMKITGNIDFAALLYAPVGTAKVTQPGNPRVFGSIAGNYVNINGNIVITYNTDLATEPPPVPDP